MSKRAVRSNRSCKFAGKWKTSNHVHLTRAEEGLVSSFIGPMDLTMAMYLTQKLGVSLFIKI